MGLKKTVREMQKIMVSTTGVTCSLHVYHIPGILPRTSVGGPNNPEISLGGFKYNLLPWCRWHLGLALGSS
jgi:hypothetical protein